MTNDNPNPVAGGSAAGTCGASSAGASKLDGTANRAMHASAGYALFIDLTGQKVVVVGGGPVAERKVQTVLPFGAEVTVVSPKLTETLRSLAASGAISWIDRAYRWGDLTGARMVFSACGNPEVDDLVCDEAHAVRALINVVDVPSKCEFIVPSTVERGPLRIAVSTREQFGSEVARVVAGQ